MHLLIKNHARYTANGFNGPKVCIDVIQRARHMHGLVSKHGSFASIGLKGCKVCIDLFKSLNHIHRLASKTHMVCADWYRKPASCARIVLERFDRMQGMVLIKRYRCPKGYSIPAHHAGIPSFPRQGLRQRNRNPLPGDDPPGQSLPKLGGHGAGQRQYRYANSGIGQVDLDLGELTALGSGQPGLPEVTGLGKAANGISHRAIFFRTHRVREEVVQGRQICLWSYPVPV